MEQSITTLELGLGEVPLIPTPHDLFYLGTDLAQKIGNTSLAIYDLEQSQLTQSETITSHEADIYERVCQMTDENGKAKYGNDGVRKAAAWKLQGQDATLVVARAERRKSAREIEVKKIQMKYYQDCLNLCRAGLNGGQFGPLTEAKDDVSNL